MPDNNKPEESTGYDEEVSKPLTFTDGAKKDEAVIRQEAKDGESKMADMRGFKPPVPDSIQLKHQKPAFTEAIEIMLHAVTKLINKANPQNKSSSNDKKKPR